MTSTKNPQSISVVIPVFAGEATLTDVVEEVITTFDRCLKEGSAVELEEIVLVHDGGQDRSDDVMRKLSNRFPIVRNIWLARNYGQHPATLAGMSCSRGDWVVTMDEDGQHNPEDIFALLDHALQSRVDLVYAKPKRILAHGVMRNSASKITKRAILPLLLGRRLPYFSSFRLILGETARSLAAYASNDVYLDVALSWVCQRSESVLVDFRNEGRMASGYSFRALNSHLLRLILSSGTRPLRLASLVGMATFVLGLVFAGIVASRKVLFGFEVVGWASLFSLILVIGGLVLLVLGVIAEYVGLLVRSATGRPLYVIANDREAGPLSRN